jgi:solute carrier family 25 phosphate transporter 3
MPYRANPFFTTTNTFFLPSVGDKVDQAIAQGKDVANKAELKLQDAKEAVKVAAKPAPTGADLYAR